MKKLAVLSLLLGLLQACGSQQENPDTTDNMETSTKIFTGAPGEIKLMTLDPGHFHAALVQKSMYEQVDSTVYIFAPEGSDVADHLGRIEGFNSREEEPTLWTTETYQGGDFLEKMIEEKPGNVVVISGNNEKKTEYILKAVEAGLNVLADKPMAINTQDFEMLKEAFAAADSNDVLLYDIMTERYEITTMLQRALSQQPDIFGELVKGTLEEPAVTKESVHHFFKYVSGNRIKRPAWFFDVSQQGEGIVDVTTHLVDLIQWECFPETIIDYNTDIELLTAKRWSTELNSEQFNTVTQLENYPDYLQAAADQNENLQVYANGEINYKIKGVHAKASVIWNYQAPEGAGDTHYSIMRGTQCNLVIRQGEEQNYTPELYIEPVEGVVMDSIKIGVEITLEEVAKDFPGIALEDSENGWHVLIPETYRVGHEAHFGQVTARYLRYLIDGKLPEWEVPNMITKYYVTTHALEMAKKEM